MSFDVNVDTQKTIKDSQDNNYNVCDFLDDLATKWRDMSREEKTVLSSAIAGDAKSSKTQLIMSASEARKISDEAYNEDLEQEMRNIEKMIKCAAERGTLQICCYGYDISESAINVLKSFGYKVSAGYQDDHHHFTIMW